ncbi:MAG: carbohydrate ABC transporter permease [Anaerolineales bacterium]|nr:carbohydrate ABC transporter permease [Anaerolineales bacterium]
MLLSVYLMPMAYMVATSLKDKAQFTETSGPLWPAREATFTYQGREYPLYKVPTEDGVKEWALVEKGREQSSFIDPANPEAGLIEWQGRWRTLERAWVFSPRWENFSTAYRLLDFGRLLRNTLAIALTGTIGTVLSCTLVAYGFARFRIPGKNIIFLILLATIILPPQVTLVPTYAVFARIGWVGTWLPLIVPHFFANAYNVFLLRQYFLTLPRELDEAAMMDGASPFRVLISVILPQAIPALTAVSLFHFFWAWNDFFGPLIYLAAEPELQPISVGIQVFNFIYGREPHMIQATAIMALALPVVLFFLSQRVFMQGVVITGVEK